MLRESIYNVGYQLFQLGVGVAAATGTFVATQGLGLPAQYFLTAIGLLAGIRTAPLISRACYKAYDLSWSMMSGAFSYVGGLTDKGYFQLGLGVVAAWGTFVATQGLGYIPAQYVLTALGSVVGIEAGHYIGKGCSTIFNKSKSMMTGAFSYVFGHTQKPEVKESVKESILDLKSEAYTPEKEIAAATMNRFIRGGLVRNRNNPRYQFIAEFEDKDKAKVKEIYSKHIQLLSKLGQSYWTEDTSTEDTRDKSSVFTFTKDKQPLPTLDNLKALINKNGTDHAVKFLDSALGYSAMFDDIKTEVFNVLGAAQPADFQQEDGLLATSAKYLDSALNSVLNTNINTAKRFSTPTSPMKKKAKGSNNTVYQQLISTYPGWKHYKDLFNVDASGPYCSSLEQYLLPFFGIRNNITSREQVDNVLASISTSTPDSSNINTHLSSTSTSDIGSDDGLSTTPPVEAASVSSVSLQLDTTKPGTVDSSDDESVGKNLTDKSRAALAQISSNGPGLFDNRTIVNEDTQKNLRQQLPESLLQAIKGNQRSASPTGLQT